MPVPMNDFPPFNFAVFASGNQVGLVRLEEPDAERRVAEVVASGYSYVGSIGLNGGVSEVLIEPGAAGLIALAGIQFAELLGPELKRFQLQQKSRN